ncbi:MAG: bifunctional hydroxymethylpyrimidine kinase/phosphomethylpyrimidine kinase [Luteitalea sp.]|nr:bifunctional hydroxymethylpyrimidine kinase/phosphomethylpyrimidine kinase [Luteitalea sp.]
MTVRPPRTALTIAGSDSGGGAGIQADLKTFAALGVYGTSAIAAITAQNTIGVTAAESVGTDLVIAQIEAVAGDIELHATKTGMLATAALVEAVAATIKALELPLVVVDPVIVAKSGDRLLDEDAVQAMRAELLPVSYVVTPNIPEAEVLSGRSIASLNDARDAAQRIHALGPGAVIVKGGHGVGAEIVDLLFDGERFVEFRTPRLRTRNTHGTGCTFASAIAAHLAVGFALAEAAERAQAYVAGAIRHGLAIGHGHGPLDHFWTGSIPRS